MLEVDHNLIREADEPRTQELIEFAQRFLEKNQDFFKYERYFLDRFSVERNPAFFEEANAIYQSLNMCAKCLLRKGGDVPKVLMKITHILELLQIILDHNKKFHTEFRFLGGAMIPKEEQIPTREGVTVEGFAAVRQGVMEQYVMHPHPSQRPDLEDRRDEFMTPGRRPVKVVTDAVHIIFSTVDRVSKDMGWTAPHQRIVAPTSSQVSFYEGYHWRVQALSEYMRLEALKAAGIENHGLSQLTLIDEQRGGARIRKGMMPGFFGHRLSFGNVDVMESLDEEGSEAQIAAMTKRIKEQILDIPFILARAIEDEYKEQPHYKDVARGGRQGISPRDLYMNVSRRR